MRSSFIRFEMPAAISARLDKTTAALQPLKDSISADEPPPTPAKRLDVIRKSVLDVGKPTRRCTLCGRESEAFLEVEQQSVWPRFESAWQTRCFCGGLWTLQ